MFERKETIQSFVLASKICLDIYPWTLSGSRASLSKKCLHLRIDHYALVKRKSLEKRLIQQNCSFLRVFYTLVHFMAIVKIASTLNNLIIGLWSFACLIACG